MKKHLRKWFHNVMTQLLILVLCLALTGCGPEWKRKFVRKRTESKPEPVFVYELQKYEREPNNLLYRKHFLFWKSWQQELVNKLGENRARDITAFEEALKNLVDMKVCLRDEKVAELDAYIRKINGFYSAYKSKDYDLVPARQMRQDLDRIMLKMDKAFRYNRVKDFIK